ncbi:MAG: hypothetical protein ACR2NK_05105 [Mariniblastus sp.]
MDDDSDYTLPCPHCKKEIFDDVDQCPHCRQYLLSSDFKKPLPKWVIVLVALTIFSFLLPTIVAAVRSFFPQ